MLRHKQESSVIGEHCRVHKFKKNQLLEDQEDPNLWSQPTCWELFGLKLAAVSRTLCPQYSPRSFVSEGSASLDGEHGFLESSFSLHCQLPHWQPWILPATCPRIFTGMCPCQEFSDFTNWKYNSWLKIRWLQPSQPAPPSVTISRLCLVFIHCVSHPIIPQDQCKHFKNH